MRRILGILVGAAGVLALAVVFLAPALVGERARLAEIADYGSSASANPRAIFLLAGVALLAVAGVLMKRR
jgi:hypothetical protein